MTKRMLIMAKKASNKYTVSPEEYNNEIKEPKTYFQPELNIELSLYEPERKK